MRAANVICSPVVLTGSFTADYDVYLVYTESALALHYNFRRAKSRMDLVVAASQFYTSCTGRSATGSILRMIETFADELGYDLTCFQSDGVSSWIDVFDGLYSNIHRVGKSKLGERVKKVFNHLVAHTFYHKMGIEIDAKIFSQLEKKKIRPTCWNVMNFIDAIMGLLLFLAKAGRQALLTGSIDAFFIDDTVVTAWMDKASRLRKEAEFINAAESIGIKTGVMVMHIEEAIREGKELLKVFKTGESHKIIHSVNLELEMVLNRYHCAVRASSTRFCPVGIHLMSRPGCGKTTIANGIFMDWCSIADTPEEGRILHQPNDKSDFDDGYKSHYDGYMLDDVGLHQPSKVQGIDKRAGSLIDLINNVALVTNQADLPDKGKIPFLSRFVVATSNTREMGIPLYFTTPEAVYRRLKYRVEPTVRPEFKASGSEEIDPAKIPEGTHPECWTFDLYKFKTGDPGSYFPIGLEMSFAALRTVLCEEFRLHIANQERFLRAASARKIQALCPECKLPEDLCICVDRSSSDDEGPIGHHSMLFQNLERMEPLTQRVVDRVDAVLKLKSELHKKHVHNHQERLMYAMIWREDICAASMDINVDRENIDMKKLTRDISEYVTQRMRQFNDAEPGERLSMLTNGSFDLEEDVYCRDYLSFQPRNTSRGHFAIEQLEFVRKIITPWTDPITTDSQKILVDKFLYDEAPALLSEGWHANDIARAAVDYVNYYKNVIEDPDRLLARDLLLTDRAETSWIHTAGLTAARLYFTSQTFRYVADTVGSWRITTWAMKRCLKPQHPCYTTTAKAAAEYDRKLLGKHPFLLGFLKAISLAAVMGAIYVLYNKFKKKEPEIFIVDEIPSQEEVKAGFDDICDFMKTDEYMALSLKDQAKCSKVAFSKQGQYFRYLYRQGDRTAKREVVLKLIGETVPEAQMDLVGVGHKPVVRPDEKKNVWITPERNITRLDVDPRRPLNIDQVTKAMERNCLYAEATFTLEGRKKIAITRILLVDARQFIINTHACPDHCTMTIWFGAKTAVGIQPSVTIEIEPHLLKRIPGRDVTIVTTFGLPCLGKHIYHLFPKKTYQSVGVAVYCIKKEDGELEVLPAHCVRRGHSNADGLEALTEPQWFTNPARPTRLGDCGAPLIIQSPLGVVIAGIHCAGQEGLAVATPIYQEDIPHLITPEVGQVVCMKPLAQVKVVNGDLKLEPHDKLFSDYHEDGRLMVLGQVQGFRPRSKATGHKTEIAEYILSRGHEFEPSIEDRLFRPNLSIKQKQNALKGYLQPTHSMKESVMLAVADAFYEHIVDGLTEEDWQDIHPVGIDVAVNGFPGVPNVDAVKFTTSGGHGWEGPKLKYLSDPREHEEWTHFREYNPEVVAAVDKILEDAAKGICSHPIFVANDKNEMVSQRKIIADKGRVFYMCPQQFLIAMRMFTMGLCRVIIRRRKLFGTAIGLNVHSEDWDDWISDSDRIPGDNWSDADFQQYEAILCILVQAIFSHLMERLAKRSGNFTPVELLILQVLLADTSRLTIDFFGLLMILLGGEGSGEGMTTTKNSLTNRMLHGYAYALLKIYKDGDEVTYATALAAARLFFHRIFFGSLGDDLLQKIHNEDTFYNHTAVAGVFANMGIVYTMADKTSESRPYNEFEKLTFLKRTFRRHECFPGLWVAPLEKESIYKMLLYTIPSTAVTPEEQLASAMQSAVSEAFYHGRDFFNQIWEVIDSAPKTDELKFRMEQMPRPTWHECYARFVNASPKFRASLLVPGDDAKTSSPADSYCQPIEVTPQNGWRVDPWGSTTKERSSEECIYTGIRLSPKETSKRTNAGERRVVENNLFSKNPTKNNTTPLPANYVDMAHKQVKSAICKVHTKDRRREKRWEWQADIRWIDPIEGPTAEDHRAALATVDSRYSTALTQYYANEITHATFTQEEQRWFRDTAYHRRMLGIPVDEVPEEIRSLYSEATPEVSEESLRDTVHWHEGELRRLQLAFNEGSLSLSDFDLFCAAEERAIAALVAEITKRAERRVPIVDTRCKIHCVVQADISDAGSIPSVPDTTHTAQDHVQQNTVFKNEPNGTVLDLTAGKPKSVYKMDMPQDLGSYLSRPQLIFSYSWAENGSDGLKATFTPWSLFFASTQMANKLQGFSMLRANLHLKFLINGSPFYYGSMMAAYTPLHVDRRDSAVCNNASVGLVAQSQKPHVWLENQNESEVQMVLPFLYPYPYVELVGTTRLANIGKIEFWQFAPLLSANGSSSTNVDIQVYAWAEDVHLAGPTQRLVAQAKISDVANTVASVASKLKAVPMLGEYAMAAEVGSRAVGAVSGLLGFTNTPVTSDVQPLKQVPFQLASVEVSEPVMKLSLQPGQEIAVGSTQFGGSEEDEMHFDSLLTRSSFLVGSDWLTTQAPGAPLFSTAVTPQLWQSDNLEAAMLPCSLISAAHQYWRGDMRFTFKVVRSQYHRGRLQISWDRGADNLNQASVLGAANPYTTIMDLDQDSECSFVVPYTQVQQFLPCNPQNTFGTATVQWTTADPILSRPVPNTNGVLSVRVVNRLTAPEPSSSVRILIFVSCEPGFQFAGPRDFSCYSGTGLWSSPNNENSVAQSDIRDMEADAHQFNDPGDDEHVTKEVFGERIFTMREQLHRSTLTFTRSIQTMPATAGLAEIRYPIKRLPLPLGVLNNGWDAATTAAGAGQRVFWGANHPLWWFGSCFIGYKGSVNVTVNLDQPDGSRAIDTLLIERVPDLDNSPSAARLPSATVSTTTSTNSNFLRWNNDRFVTGRAGMALTNTKTNTGLVANLPYYCNSGFLIMDNTKEYNNQQPLTDNDADWWAIRFRYPKGTETNSASSFVNVFYGSGPDFDLVFFINVPVLTFRPVTTP